MGDTKTKATSVTIWGGVIAFISGALPLFSILTGVTVGPEDSQSLIQELLALGASIGGITAIIGRIRATKLIG